MLNIKRGTSVISLVLCGVALTLVVSALVVATSNSAMYRAQMIAENNSKVIEHSAYTKVYTLSEVKTIAKQAFTNNYLALYDNEVGMSGFEALVIGEMRQTVPQEQLDNYNIYVTRDGIEVQYK